jgi:hypothetical protein
MALRLFAGSQNTWRIKGDNDAKFTAPPHRCNRSWLSKLERETIGSWEELIKQFTSNFKSTYKWLASIEEVKACVQQHNEPLGHTFKDGTSSKTLQSKFQMSEQLMPLHLGYDKET